MPQGSYYHSACVPSIVYGYSEYDISATRIEIALSTH